MRGVSREKGQVYIFTNFSHLLLVVQMMDKVHHLMYHYPFVE